MSQTNPKMGTRKGESTTEINTEKNWVCTVANFLTHPMLKLVPQSLVRFHQCFFQVLHRFHERKSSELTSEAIKNMVKLSQTQATSRIFQILKPTPLYTTDVFLKKLRRF